MAELFVMATMDCEPVRSMIPESRRDISRSGPADWQASERSIRGYAGLCAAYGWPLTLFVHPEVAAEHRGLLRELEQRGCCLGLHLHPYKLAAGDYRLDLGAYPATEQRRMIAAAAAVWRRQIGHAPQYFRAGYFSANDMTFGVLEKLGFAGGSVSIPGRVLPDHQSVWAGASAYPHAADAAFRLSSGASSFVEVPVSVDYQRPVARGAAGEIGYEWPYLAAEGYDFRAVAGDIVERFAKEAPPIAVFVTDVHNDQDLSDLDHPAARNLRTLFDEVLARAAARNLTVKGTTIEAVCRTYRQLSRRVRT
jgi:peptidoglycan/xylan/chitin deacetylase (PgdA/CDA1 family)